MCEDAVRVVLTCSSAREYFVKLAALVVKQLQCGNLVGIALKHLEINLSNVKYKDTENQSRGVTAVP